jgi:hypothetical protein
MLHLRHDFVRRETGVQRNYNGLRVTSGAEQEIGVAVYYARTQPSGFAGVIQRPG